VVVEYNFDVDGPAIVGQTMLSMGRTIPAGSFMTRYYFNRIETPVGPTNMGLGLGFTSPTDIFDKPITHFLWTDPGLYDLSVANTFRNIKLPVATDSVILTCTDNPTSAGHFQILIEWVIPPFQ